MEKKQKHGFKNSLGLRQRLFETIFCFCFSNTCIWYREVNDSFYTPVCFQVKLKVVFK